MNIMNNVVSMLAVDEAMWHVGNDICYVGGRTDILIDCGCVKSQPVIINRLFCRIEPLCLLFAC